MHHINARHLNDFTGSAYCMVENCHGDGDFHGAYVTHGQFEHDLTYVGNSGLLSFANSGPTWGSSAKRITVVRHTGFGASASQRSAILPCRTSPSARTGAYDGVNTEGYGPCGTFLLNADGLQMRGCTAEKLVLTQRSRRAKRPAIVEGCWFRDGIEVVRTGEAAVAPGTPLILRDNLTGPWRPAASGGKQNERHPYSGYDAAACGIQDLDADAMAALEHIGTVHWNTLGRQYPGRAGRGRTRHGYLRPGWGTPVFDEAVLAQADRLRLMPTGGSVKPYVTDAVYGRGIRVVSGNRCLRVRGRAWWPMRWPACGRFPITL